MDAKAGIIAIALTLATSNITPSMAEVTFYTKKQAKCLIDNIYHEARGETVEGQLAVAKVTLNRAQDLSNICKVVYAYKQFSWNKKKKATDMIAYYKAYLVAHQALNYELNATHYHAVSVRPVWSKRLAFVKQIGNHKFYE